MVRRINFHRSALFAHEQNFWMQLSNPYTQGPKQFYDHENYAPCSERFPDFFGYMLMKSD